jgi:large subunit ribosomal protein L19
MHTKLIEFNQKIRATKKYPDFKSGDVVKIFRKITEGSKERLQSFQGTIIAIKGGQSSSPTITVRKVSFGVGVELVLPLYSPQIEKIEFVKRTRARRAKLYYVRTKSVRVLSKKLKEVSVKEVIVPEEGVAEEVVPMEAAPVEQAAVADVADTK